MRNAQSVHATYHETIHFRSFDPIRNNFLLSSSATRLVASGANRSNSLRVVKCIEKQTPTGLNFATSQITKSLFVITYYDFFEKWRPRQDSNL